MYLALPSKTSLLANDLSRVVRVQSAVTLTTSEPEPDLAVVREDAGGYTTRHPTAADVGLVIEVADSTLPGDRADKGPIYAEAGIACYWIVNIPDRQIEVYEDPQPDRGEYARRTDYRPGQTISLPLGTASLSVTVAELLPG